jgi:hypothetical protein
MSVTENTRAHLYTIGETGLAVFIWFFYAAKRERRKPASALPPESDVNRWNEALEKMSHL